MFLQCVHTNSFVQQQRRKSQQQMLGACANKKATTRVCSGLFDFKDRQRYWRRAMPSMASGINAFCGVANDVGSMGFP